MKKRKITVIKGDGVGPELIASVIQVMEAAGAPLTWDYQVAGSQAFKEGITSGVPISTIKSIQKNGVVLKAPLETPVGYGEKSANVTLRKQLETYSNIRPVTHLPNIESIFKHIKIDLTVIRENLEGLYAGIEYMQTSEVAQGLKLATKRGCEKIIRYAFEFAKANGKTKVHCATKANILKLTEGMMKRAFETIAVEYPNIEAHHILIDNCAHQLVRRPEQFQVIVTSNMNGDILSDLTSGLVGGLGVAPSANIGDKHAIFEAVHGSAPDIANQNLANPTALLLSCCMMLDYLSLEDIAGEIRSALHHTLKEGHLTSDIASKNSVGTAAFTKLIIDHIKSDKVTTKQLSHTLPHVTPLKPKKIPPQEKKTVGVDIFIENESLANKLGLHLEKLTKKNHLSLHALGNKGSVVYPTEHKIEDISNHWQCRFKLKDTAVTFKEEMILELLEKLWPHYQWIHIEKLFTLDGEQAFSNIQGE